MPKEEKIRKRMVVEEVNPPSAPIEEIKEKVDELQNLTEELSDTVEKSADVQEEIAKAADDVVPEMHTEEDLKSEVVSQNDKEEPADDVSKNEEFIHSNDTPEVVPQIVRGNSANPLIIILPGIFLLGALLGGIYFYQKRVVPAEVPTPNPLSTQTNTAAPVPTATPLIKIDYSKYPINVLNGSGIVGEAGKAKTALTGAGFTVSNTGNASSYNFTKTVIKAKADVPAEFLTKLSETLSKTYSLDANQSLATSSADSVQVIIGSTKAK